MKNAVLLFLALIFNLLILFRSKRNENFQDLENFDLLLINFSLFLFFLVRSFILIIDLTYLLPTFGADINVCIFLLLPISESLPGPFFLYFLLFLASFALFKFESIASLIFKLFALFFLLL